MTISTPARPVASSNVSRIVVACLAIVFGVCAPAAAQVEPIEPTWMIAAREAPLRCGELSTFYKVADLEPGTVVRVDGRSSRWARVIYPAGQVGYVRNEDAQDVRDGTLRVAEVNAIKAPNQISGLTGSWRSIYSIGSIRPGTRLTIVGQAESKDGQRVGYRVAPPMPPAVDHPPYGYVQLAALRDATQSEIDAHLASLKPVKAPVSTPATKPEAEPEAEPVGTEKPSAATDASESNTPETTTKAIPAETKAPVATKTPLNTDTAPATGTTTTVDDKAADTSLIEDMAVPTAEDLTPEVVSAAPVEAATPEDAGTETAAQGTTPAPRAPEITPAKRDYLLWSELEETLTKVRRQGGRVLEDSLEELIAEYERSLANTDTPAARSAFSNRLEWLRVRKEARDQRREIEATLVQAKQLRRDVTRERTQWQTARGYDMVGRLVTSAIYDGTRLPRMYRIVTEGETGLTRTIGYVRDDPNLNLEGLLGSVVGVAGRARLDDSLRLRVISPTNIDRFQATVTP